MWARPGSSQPFDRTEFHADLALEKYILALQVQGAPHWKYQAESTKGVSDDSQGSTVGVSEAGPIAKCMPNSMAQEFPTDQIHELLADQWPRDCDQ